MTRMDRMNNENVRHRLGLRENIYDRVDVNGFEGVRTCGGCE